MMAFGINGKRSMSELFMSHPPIEQRIAACVADCQTPQENGCPGQPFCPGRGVLPPITLFDHEIRQGQWRSRRGTCPQPAWRR